MASFRPRPHRLPPLRPPRPMHATLHSEGRCPARRTFVECTAVAASPPRPQPGPVRGSGMTRAGPLFMRPRMKTGPGDPARCPAPLKQGRDSPSRRTTLPTPARSQAAALTRASHPAYTPPRAPGRAISGALGAPGGGNSPGRATLARPQHRQRVGLDLPHSRREPLHQPRCFAHAVPAQKKRNRGPPAPYAEASARAPGPARQPAPAAPPRPPAELRPLARHGGGIRPSSANPQTVLPLHDRKPRDRVNCEELGVRKEPIARHGWRGRWGDWRGEGSPACRGRGSVSRRRAPVVMAAPAPCGAPPAPGRPAGCSSRPAPGARPTAAG